MPFNMLIYDFYGYQPTFVAFNGNFVCLMILKNNFQSFSLLEVYGNDYFSLKHQFSLCIFIKDSQTTVYSYL